MSNPKVNPASLSPGCNYT